MCRNSDNDYLFLSSYSYFKLCPGNSCHRLSIAGFGLVADLKMMKSSLPHLGGVTLGGAGYVDLAVLWRKLVQKHHFVFPYTGERQTCCLM